MNDKEEEFPKTIYRAQYTGFEPPESPSEPKKHKIFSDNGELELVGCNSLLFADEDSLFDTEKFTKDDLFNLKMPFIRRTIICFSEEFKDEPLKQQFLKKYSKRLIIGISIDEKFLKAMSDNHDLKLAKVKYEEEIPKLINYSPEEIAAEANNEIVSWIEKVITTKLLKYKHEKEYRFFGIGKELARDGLDKAIPLPKENIKEIILGCEMTNEAKKATIDFCNKHLPKVPLKEAYPEQNEIKTRDIKQ